MPENTFFLLGLSLILMHEMDAIRCKEWRIFPGISLLDDKLGFRVFMFAHVPLFYWILDEISQSDNNTFIYGFNYFLIIHLGLHILFLFHKKNEFKDWVSWTLIIGAAVSGLIDLIKN